MAFLYGRICVALKDFELAFQAYLHSMNVMHRDLNSKNCLVETEKVNTSESHFFR